MSASVRFKKCAAGSGGALAAVLLLSAPAYVRGSRGVSTLACGSSFCAAVTAAGGVTTWGYLPQSMPALMAGDRVVGVSAASSSACYLGARYAYLPRGARAVLIPKH